MDQGVQGRGNNKHRDLNPKEARSDIRRNKRPGAGKQGTRGRELTREEWRVEYVSRESREEMSSPMVWK